MAGKPIPVGTADDMITAYIDYMTGLGVDMNDQTQSVGFSRNELMNWLNTVMPRADELKVFMGLYLPGHVKAGHTTVILWPYKNGQPIQSEAFQMGEDGGTPEGGGGMDEPYNDGQGNP